MCASLGACVGVEGGGGTTWQGCTGSTTILSSVLRPFSRGMAGALRDIMAVSLAPSAGTSAASSSWAFLEATFWEASFCDFDRGAAVPSAFAPPPVPALDTALGLIVLFVELLSASPSVAAGVFLAGY